MLPKKLLSIAALLIALSTGLAGCLQSEEESGPGDLDLDPGAGQTPGDDINDGPDSDVGDDQNTNPEDYNETSEGNETIVS